MQPIFPAPNDTQTPIFSKTPFHLKEGHELVLENKNTTCSHAEIDTLIQKRIINLIDLELIKTMALFPFINANNLTYYLNNAVVLHKNYQKNTYLNNLNKLKKAGIVARYCFVSQPCIPASGQAYAASSLRLYSLTPPALSYITPLLSDAHPLPLASDTLRKLEIAALNQFLIHFLVHYPDRIKQMVYLENHKHGSSPITFDAVIQYHSQNSAFRMSGTISLVLLSVREANGWIPRTVHRLKLLHTLISRNRDKYRLPFYLILAEHITMITDLHPYLQIPTLQDIPFYYSLDTISSVYPPLDGIYSCQQSEEDLSITATRQSITI